MSAQEEPVMMDKGLDIYTRKPQAVGPLGFKEIRVEPLAGFQATREYRFPLPVLPVMQGGTGFGRPPPLFQLFVLQPATVGVEAVTRIEGTAAFTAYARYTIAGGTDIVSGMRTTPPLPVSRVPCGEV